MLVLIITTQVNLKTKFEIRPHCLLTSSSVLQGLLLRQQKFMLLAVDETLPFLSLNVHCMFGDGVVVLNAVW
jgi:hypothetical protein